MLTGAHPGRSTADELTVFKSLGLGVEDLAAAELVVRKAPSAGSAPRSSSDPARRDRASARDDRRRRDPHAARPPRDRRAGAEIWLKLENLQPIGSFKIRGAVNAIRQAPREETAQGVVTASAGNMAQGVAWAARELGRAGDDRRARAGTADEARRDRAPRRPRRQGARTSAGGRSSSRAAYEDADGLFVHPVQDERVMAGNGTIGLELAEQLPEADTVLVPWGGGGLFTGIASALAAVPPETRVYAVQPETGAAVTAALEAGEPREAAGFRPSFVDGAGAKVVLAPMWERAQPLLAGRVRGLARGDRCSCPPARGAGRGSSPKERARSRSPPRCPGRVPGEKLVCIVSGGNIDADRLAAILRGETPD